MMSASANVTPRTAYRRSLHYVDRSVQRSLLVAMVALEAVLVAASTWFVYWRLSDMLEEGLYRVHLAPAGPALTALAQEGYSVLGVFAVLNVLALLLAEGIWSRHENAVLRDFAARIGQTRALDFSGDAKSPRRHEVLELVVAWRAAERTRFAAIREQVGKLDAAVAAGVSARELRMSVERLNLLLP